MVLKNVFLRNCALVIESGVGRDVVRNEDILDDNRKVPRTNFSFDSVFFGPFCFPLSSLGADISSTRDSAFPKMASGKSS